MKTLITKFTKLESEGRSFHIEFSDGDLKFKVTEYTKVKKWHSQRPVEVAKTIYEGSSEMFQDITKQMLYQLDAALRSRKEAIEEKILGVNSFTNILEEIKKVSQKQLK